MDLSQRIALQYKVATRYLLAKGLEMGKTFQNEKVRVHRYRELLVVTDIRDAGKRGKKCLSFHTSPTYHYKGDTQEWLDKISGGLLDFVSSADPYSKMKGFITDIQKEFPGEVDLEERPLKSISVEPFGIRYDLKIPQDDGKSEIWVRANPIDFGVTSHYWHEGPQGKPGFHMDTLYSPDKRQDASVFYGWLRDNVSKINSFTMDDFRQTWKTLGVRYDSH